MHIIARPAISAAKLRHRDAARWLDGWWAVASRRSWTSLDDVRRDYPTADQVGRCLVFDSKGNKYRLVCGVSYARSSTQGTLFVKHFLTHAEYDSDQWKKDC